MKWTRRFFDQWEWYHRPVSPMEGSLLLPVHVDQSLSLISQRLKINFPYPTWKIINGFLYFSNQYHRLLFQPSAVILPIRFWRELKVAKSRWLKKVLSNYQNRINQYKRTNLTSQPTDKLLKLLTEAVNMEGQLMAESVYVGIYAITMEVLLKMVYRYWVSDTSPLDYHELLIGYPDKGIEADLQLWQIAQKKNSQQPQELKVWLQTFGHRIQDKDIMYPTLGEQSEVINSLLGLYKNSPNPRLRIDKARQRRQLREEFVAGHLTNLPGIKRLFHWIKFIAQDYVQIRNSRPFYYQGNMLIRQMLFTLGRRTEVVQEKDDVFFLTFNELRQALQGESVSQLQAKIKQERQLYYQRLTVKPLLEVRE